MHQHYSWYTELNGTVLVIENSDRQTCVLQGDDAAKLIAELELALPEAEQQLLSEYADLME